MTATVAAISPIIANLGTCTTLGHAPLTTDDGRALTISSRIEMIDGKRQGIDQRLCSRCGLAYIDMTPIWPGE